MKVLFDHNVPRKLRRVLIGHEIFTAEEMGWSSLQNGLLLRVAEDAGFSAMITGDKNLYHQQNLANRGLAIVVLRTINWNILKLETKQVQDALDATVAGSYQVLS